MAYFSNGNEGMQYEEEYCSKCVHGMGKPCAVWAAHMLHNYDECNNKESILHILIPQDNVKDWGTFAGECKMFIKAENDH